MPLRPNHLQNNELLKSVLKRLALVKSGFLNHPEFIIITETQQHEHDIDLSIDCANPDENEILKQAVLYYLIQSGEHETFTTRKFADIQGEILLANDGFAYHGRCVRKWLEISKNSPLISTRQLKLRKFITLKEAKTTATATDDDAQLELWIGKFKL